MGLCGRLYAHLSGGKTVADARRNAEGFDGCQFTVNRNKFPPNELLKYAGKCVAWSLDGTRILASGDDYDEVERQLVAAGIDPSQVVEGIVETPEGEGPA
jgi:hypothetical protein